MFPIGGAVSAPARFNPPTEDDLREFIDLSLNLLCIAGTDGYFKHVNPAWETTFDYTKEELLSRPYLEFVHPNDRETMIAEATNIASGRSTLSFENRYRCKDGSYKWLFWSTVVRPERGLIYCIAADVTEQKREEARLAAQYAVTRVLADAPTLASATPRILQAVCQSLDRSVGAIWRVDQKDKLLRCVETWHTPSAQVNEFDQGTHSRTFPPGVIGMAELALATRITREQREYLNAIQGSADALLTLVNDLLDFSKIEARKLQLDHVGFNLRDALEDSMQVLAPRAHQKGLELACHIHHDVPDALVGDPLRLRQIVLNLVGNAIKFTEHGEVVLRVQADSCRNGNAQLRFSVTDTGIGIPPEKQAVIFEAFSQADSSTTRRYGGTGLALAISAQLVELMGGRISVESRPDQGSTFHFTAVFEVQQPGMEKPPARWRTLTDLPVLIVDDNATNRRILEEVFTNWHMRPIAVESGAAALGTLEKSLRADQPFAVVLLDGHMPDMDGFSVAERISHDRRYAGIKLVMLTSAVSPKMSGAVASWASQRISPSRSSNPSSLMRLSVPSVSQC
jgi:PAS domain S-box-containing protein